jgi:catechol 2,3-dioxygenase-like lactoylglutathione lyase family enzyme
MALTFWHVSFTVSDIDQSIAFYRDILGLELKSGPRNGGGKGTETGTIVGFPGARLKVAGLKLNDDCVLELLQYVHPEGKKRVETQRCDVGSAHVAFLVKDVQAKYEELKEKGVHFVSAPARDTRGRPVAYFYDPDGITLELAGMTSDKEP